MGMELDLMSNFLSVAFPKDHPQLCRGDCHKAMHVLIIVCLDGRQIGHDSLKQTGTDVSFAFILESKLNADGQ